MKGLQFYDKQACLILSHHVIFFITCIVLKYWWMSFWDNECELINRVELVIYETGVLSYLILNKLKIIIHVVRYLDRKPNRAHKREN